MNEDPKDAQIRSFQEEIERLQRELQARAQPPSTPASIRFRFVVSLSLAGLSWPPQIVVVKLDCPGTDPLRTPRGSNALPGSNSQTKRKVQSVQIK